MVVTATSVPFTVMVRFFMLEHVDGFTADRWMPNIRQGGCYGAIRSFLLTQARYVVNVRSLLGKMAGATLMEFEHKLA